MTRSKGEVKHRGLIATLCVLLVVIVGLIIGNIIVVTSKPQSQSTSQEDKESAGSDALSTDSPQGETPEDNIPTYPDFINYDMTDAEKRAALIAAIAELKATAPEPGTENCLKMVEYWNFANNFTADSEQKLPISDIESCLSEAPNMQPMEATAEEAENND